MVRLEKLEDMSSMVRTQAAPSEQSHIGQTHLKMTTRARATFLSTDAANIGAWSTLTNTQIVKVYHV